VTDYSSEGGNAIHYDPAVAAQFGYRAPIAGGLMGVRSLMATLCLSDGPPNEIDIGIRFRRPMFWDETLDVMRNRSAQGGVSHLALVNGSGKVAIEAEIAHLR
jgi:acyl dehydratase